MSFRALLAWGFGLWVAAGIESALGGGVPGPLFLFAIAAGFSAGNIPGVIIGALAGFCSAALGGPLFLSVLAGISCGLVSSLFARFFSRRNLLVAMAIAALLSFSLCLLFGFSSGHPSLSVLRYALWCGVLHALWVFPIYGIVLVVSPTHSSTLSPWNSRE